MFTALLALCMVRVPGKENLVLKDFDSVKVVSSGCPRRGPAALDMLGVLQGRSLWSPCPLHSVGCPWNFPDCCSTWWGGGGPDPGPCSCSSSPPPQFSGFWYEIAFASKLQGSPPKVRKVGAVLVELEGDHLALTTSYEE